MYRRINGNNNVAVSDVYGGFTDNSIVGSRLHSSSCWDRSDYENQGNQSSELFAHYFSRNMIGNSIQIGSMQEYFPETCEYLSELMEDITDEELQ